MCCRLQLDLRELLKRGNGLFGSAEQTGSLGVVTINCARLGYLHAGDEAALLARWTACWSWAAQPGDQAQGDPAPDGPGPVPLHQALPGHAAQPLLDAGRERHQRDDPQLHARPHDITSEGHALALRLLDHVRARMSQFQEETGHLYNLEATPAEGTTYRFAKEDRKRWPASCRPARRQPYYTNSSQLPVGFTDDRSRR
jgi:ribonucleoside-triphosphate reductase